MQKVDFYILFLIKNIIIIIINKFIKIIEYFDLNNNYI